MQSSSKDRQDLELSAWSWVDEIDDPLEDPINPVDLIAAYRLNFPVHKSPEWKCKKNCRSNPRCYYGLGELQWLEPPASAEDAASTTDEEDDVSLERRLQNMPVGLKNLGNTCYVNSFLQIWFHNVPFREALYKWDPGHDPVEAQNETILEAEKYRPEGKVASLQALFAMMEFTNRKAVDPNDFIAKLGLDPQVQQDAAEFSKLFISLLESSLSNQTCEQVRSIVQDQFRGKYAYVTRCHKCLKESKNSTYFYELDLALQGQKTLINCIEDFLKEEKLEGDNQYYCGGCESKQDASRCVRLADLPPVLNLQLNRFIFDMQTGRKKKLNSFVQFPEVLDMSSYLRQSASDHNTYHLTGVLMHVGAEANHGHYIAHIQEATSGQWFKFSDAYVEKLQGRNPKLGSENDPLLSGSNLHVNGSNSETTPNKRTLNGSASKSKANKGNQGSNNAYMLVYTSAAALSNIRSRPKLDEGETPNKRARKAKEKEGAEKEGPLPMYLKAFIEQDRSLLEEEIKEQVLQKQTKMKEQVSLRAKMKAIYQRIPYGEDTKFEFIPMEWLTRFFVNPSAIVPINMSASMCVHGNLDLNKIQDVKAVSVSVAEELFKEAKVDNEVQLKIQRLNQDSLCLKCVRNRCRTMKQARSIHNDHKVITEMLKHNPQDNEGHEHELYWIGKNTLKKWRTFAREYLYDLIAHEDKKFAAERSSSLKKASNSKLSIAEVQSKLSKVGTDVIVSSFEQPQQNGTSNGHHFSNADGEFFNSDIICSHDNLSIVDSRRKLVSEDVWKKICSYFPKARTFPQSSPLCQFCLANHEKARTAAEAKKEVANTQKNSLGDILNERNRPSWARASLNKVYLIPRSFVSEWRSFVRNPLIHDVVKLIPNEMLLCSHGGLIYPLDLDTESDYESVDAWKDLDKKRVYMVSEEEWSILKETFAVDREISVVRNKNDCKELLSSEPPVCEECLENRCKAEEEEQLDYKNVTVYVRRLMGGEIPPKHDPSDPDFDCMMNNGLNGNSAKRPKLGNGVNGNGHCHSPDFVRRSNRRQKVRGEREFTVSSDMKLKDFKVKIMEAFKVAPFDQNLCLNGLYLTDSSKTLGELKVLPKSLIYLRADEPNPGASALEPDDGWLMQHPEEGFKGTGLLEGS